MSRQVKLLKIFLILSINNIVIGIYGQDDSRKFFRTELFPEQLEQQQIQFRQAEIQNKLLDLQRMLQVSGPNQISNVLDQQVKYQQELQALQDRQLLLQEEIQRKLGAPVTFRRHQQQTQTQQRQPIRTTPTPIQENLITAQPRNDFVLPCQTAEGNEGLCRPLVKCLSFYADLPELRKQPPCPLGQDEQGVCCPSNKPVHRPAITSGVIRPPPPPRVPIPPLTQQQLSQAAQQSLQVLQNRLNLAEELFINGIFTRPNTPAAWHLEFFQTSNQTLAEGSQAQKGIDASESLVNEFNLSPDQGTFALPSFSILNTVIADTCPRISRCFLTKYRTVDGSCNNLLNSHWGQAGTALQRILPPKYADGVTGPRFIGSDGIELPSARLLSTEYSPDVDKSSENFTIMVMQWGQFLDHDLTHTPISRGRGGNGISCCRDGLIVEPRFRHPDCFPIILPRTDKIFSPFGERCMEFARSLPAPRPQCNFGPREQMNQITGWLDGSNIYGSNEATLRSLREFRGGRLKAQNIRGRQLLPPNPSECSDDLQRLSCFQAGDGRVNEQVQLALMHTLWMREHNRVADILSSLNRHWSDEAIFQEAKRIIVAEIQHITYNEFLPIILGQEYMNKFLLSPKENGYSRLYDSELNGGITNVFATAAFRFGHSLIQGHLHGYGQFGNVRENMRLSKQHFSPFVLYQEGAVDDFIRGLSAQKSQKVDRFFSKELTDHLFQGDLDIGLDLLALNIQRGRDHGLPPYNDWREVCGAPRARNWQDLEAIMDRQSISLLSRLYSSVDEVDLFIGAVSERSLPGAMMGPTLVCLVGDQFARLRRGDRFYYEESNQPSSFSEEQLRQIKKTSLARVLCDNSDDIALMQPLAFVQPSFLNQRVMCNSNSIPWVDLRAWANERAAVL